MPWELTGNSGINPTTNFLGTTDNQPLVIRTNGTEVMRLTTSGNVGIGTEPQTTLDVQGTVRFTNQGDGAVLLNLSSERRWEFRQLRSGAGTALELASVGGGGNKDFIINTTGHVCIGTTSPHSGAALDVNGIINSTGLNVDGNIIGRDISASGGLNVSANINAGGLNVDGNSIGNRLDINGNINASGDVILSGAASAEDFEIDESCLSEAEPGTVMVLDDSGNLRPRTTAYDKRVTGVVSGAGNCKPGIILDRQSDRAWRRPLALVGKVFCKVDATSEPVSVGDLLTTSATPGHAMKATDPLQAFGTVLGKALRPLKEGRSLIPILVCLQ